MKHLDFPDPIVTWDRGPQHLLVWTWFACYRVVFRNGEPYRYKKIKGLGGWWKRTEVLGA